MKISVQVDGRKMNIPEEELSQIVKKHYLDLGENDFKCPIEGKEFKINLKSIKEELFSKPRKNSREEWCRQLILQAMQISNCYSNPEEYPKNFSILIPEKTWESKTVEELLEFCEDYGGRLSTWYEQALMWAVRISNGEEWKKICDQSDSFSWYRILTWKDNKIHLIGGASKKNYYHTEIDLLEMFFVPAHRLMDVVPMITIYN